MTQPYVLPDAQPWAVDQMRRRHNEALYRLGEYSLFFLMWWPEDEEAGLVQRCLACSASNPVFETYQQPSKRKCPDCFGTTFEGGYKAKLYRPSIWEIGEVTQEIAARGEIEKNVTAIQTTSDFRLRTGDYIIRADNTRWQMRDNAGIRLHTGFKSTNRLETIVGYSYDNVSMEDESSVAYMLPPTSAAEISTLLDLLNPRTPHDYTDDEFIAVGVSLL